MEILLFEEHFVSIHITLSGQTHGCSKNLATTEFYRMKREYRSSRGSWQKAPRMSISLGSYSTRPQNSPPLAPLLLQLNATVISGSASGHAAGLQVEAREVNFAQTAVQLLTEGTVDVSQSFTRELLPWGFCSCRVQEVDSCLTADAWLLCVTWVHSLLLRRSQIIRKMSYSQEVI